MKNIELTELLHINNPQEYKLVLNLHSGRDGERFIDQWSMSSLEELDVGFSYWAYSGKSKNGKLRANFQIGDKCLGFIQIKDDEFLFITAGEITAIPMSYGACGFSPLKEYDAFRGRLVVRTHKGNTFSRYVFKLDNYLKDREIIVQEILPGEYHPIAFDGYEKVHFSFPLLLQVLKSNRYAEYRKHLSLVNGIYCLTDTNNGKLYVGSAYGQDGIAQRWECYLDTQTGGNKELLALYNSKTDEYFKDYFTFTLLETIDKRQPLSKIVERESYWKIALDTRRHGYNKN